MSEDEIRRLDEELRANDLQVAYSEGVLAGIRQAKEAMRPKQTSEEILTANVESIKQQMAGLAQAFSAPKHVEILRDESGRAVGAVSSLRR